MMRLILFECRKLLKKRIFVLLSGMLLLVLLYQFYDQCQERHVYDKDLYLVYHDIYAAMPEEEALKKLSRDADGLMIVQFRESFLKSGMDEGVIKDIYGPIAEQYGSTYEDFVSEYESFTDDPENLEDVSRILPLLRDQTKYISVYRTFLEEFPERAETLKRMAVFSGKDTYAYRSIEKSLKDFSKLDDVKITPDIEEGVQMLKNFDWSFLFMAALILICGSVLYAEEESSGEHRLHLTTKKGRTTLAFAKWISLMLYCLLISGILYGGKLILAGKIMGYGDLNRTLQSVSAFRNCAFRMTVGDFLLQSFLTPMLFCVFTGTLTALLYNLFPQVWLSVSVMGAYLGLSVLIYRTTADNAAFNFFKFVNPVSFADVGSRFASYNNADLFGYPVSVLPSLYTVGSILLCLFLTLYLLAFSGKIRLPAVSLKLKRKIRIRGSVKLFSHEAFRLYIPALGILVIAASGGLNARRLEGELRLNTEDYWYYAYGQEISGEISEETGHWFDEKRTELFKEQEALSRMQKEGEAVSITQSQTLEAKNKALDRVYQEYTQLMSVKAEGIPVHYISGIITDPVFSDLTSFLLYGMLMLVLVSFSACAVFAEDQETGLSSLLRSTKNGRKRDFYVRYINLFLLYAVIFILFIFPLCYNWIRVYRMHDFSAPVQSILNLSRLKGNMSIRTMVIVWLGASFISGAAFMILLSLLAKPIRKKSTTLIVTVFIIAVDFLMAILNFPVVSQVLLVSGFGLPEMLKEASHTRFVWIIFVKNLSITAGLFLWHRHQYVRDTGDN